MKLSFHPALAVLLLAALGGLAVQQSAARLRAGYILRQRIEGQGLLVNEVRWQRSRLSRLSAVPSLLTHLEADIAGGKARGKTIIVRRPSSRTPDIVGRQE